MMIDKLIFKSGVICRGGLIAYYNDTSVYCPDPALPFSRALALLICGDGQVLICPVDLTQPDQAADAPVFRRISLDMFGARSTGALFASGRYFSIRSGAMAGGYQITDDRIVNEEFPNPRAYRSYLLGKKR